MKLCEENLREGGNINTFQKKGLIAHNLETLGGIRKENATLLETSLLKNYGKLSNLSPKHWADLYQKGSS